MKACTPATLLMREALLIPQQQAPHPVFLACGGWSYRRGFVNSVALTLADFDRHAAALFAAAPITSVRLTDRDPVLRYEGVCWTVAFGRGTIEECRHPHEIPRTLARTLKVRDFDGSSLGNVAAFRHRENADAWLSAACVAYGRSLAGLPPIPVREIDV